VAFTYLYGNTHAEQTRAVHKPHRTSRTRMSHRMGPAHARTSRFGWAHLNGSTVLHKLVLCMNWCMPGAVGREGGSPVKGLEEWLWRFLFSHHLAPPSCSAHGVRLTFCGFGSRHTVPVTWFRRMR